TRGRRTYAQTLPRRSRHQFVVLRLVCYSLPRPPPRPSLFPYTTLFRSHRRRGSRRRDLTQTQRRSPGGRAAPAGAADHRPCGQRSEEHTSELQSREKLVCRLLLEKKNDKKPNRHEVETERHPGTEQDAR